MFSALADPAKVHHIGPLGQSYLAKLLVNLVWFGQAVAVTEALLLAARAGLDLARLNDALPSPTSRPGSARTRGWRRAAARPDPEHWSRGRRGATAQ